MPDSSIFLKSISVKLSSSERTASARSSFFKAAARFSMAGSRTESISASSATAAHSMKASFFAIWENALNETFRPLFDRSAGRYVALTKAFSCLTVASDRTECVFSFIAFSFPGFPFDRKKEPSLSQQPCFKRRLPDLNRRSGCCRPMPYHLAKTPKLVCPVILQQVG